MIDNVKEVRDNSIKQFGSKTTQKTFLEVAKRGLWQSEEILIKKYFKPGSFVLDIGCGSGRATMPLFRMGYKILGVDITPEMIETAKKVASSEGINIDYRIGDATRLEFSDNFFDAAIFANNGWTQIPGKENRQRALNEIYRVIKPGGHFILTAHQRYYSGGYLSHWIMSWIKLYLLKPLGFKVEEIDFGDLFFKINYKGKETNQRQYIHITGSGEVEEQIKKAGFKLEMRKRMGDLSKDDAESMRGSLSKYYNSYKSPVFFVCVK